MNAARITSSCTQHGMLRIEIWHGGGRREYKWINGKGCEVEGAETTFGRFDEYQIHSIYYNSLSFEPCF